MPSTSSNWVMPSVATVTTMRGELRNRRMNATSTMAPSSNAITRPTPMPRKYGQPQNRMNDAANPVGTVPSSACAKFTTRLAR